MRLFKHGFANSLYNLFAQSSLTVRSQPTDCTDAIRHSMLALLGDELAGLDTLALVRRIRLAMDVQELWYLRDALMSAVAQQLGENAARQRMAALDRLFDGQLPRGLTGMRASRLRH